MAEDILICFSLIILNGILALAESSIVNSKRSRLESLAKKGSRSARSVLELASKSQHFEARMRTIMGILILVSGLILGTGTIGNTSEWFGSRGLSEIPAQLASYFSLLTVFSMVYFVLGTSLPQTLGALRPESMALVLVGPVRLVLTVFQPLTWIFSGLSFTLMRILGYKQNQDEASITEEEVIEVIAQGTSSGTIEEVEQDMLERVLMLGDRSVASIMTNRIEMEWIDVNEAAAQVLEQIVQSNHSLFPVCDGELDRVVGMLSSKKFLVALQTNPKLEVKDLVDQVRVLPENMKALAALEEFKTSKTKIAIVVDEYGSVQGILTQSDLFESIIAEHDEPDEENEISIVQRDQNSYLIDGLLPFEEFIQYFEIEDVDLEDRSGFNSLAGFILHLSKQIPTTGERFAWKHYEFEVVDMDGNRIDKLLFTIHQTEEN